MFCLNKTNISIIVSTFGWQLILLASANAQSIHDSTPRQNSLRSSTAVVRKISDAHLYENPLRSSEKRGRSRRRNIASPANPKTNTAELKTARKNRRGTNFVRQASHQIELLPQEDEDVIDELELESTELGDESDSNEDTELEDVEEETDEFAELGSEPRTDVRSPIRDNPFAEIQQSDPYGLISGGPVLRQQYVDRYSDISGQLSQNHLAGYNAHRFHHSPLYFEERNLERYGNELQFQRATSAATFFVNSALLPAKYIHSPGFSRVPTLGHRRPGEFVPYRRHQRLAELPNRIQYPHQ